MKCIFFCDIIDYIIYLPNYIMAAVSSSMTSQHYFYGKCELEVIGKLLGKNVAVDKFGSYFLVKFQLKMFQCATTFKCSEFIQ